MSSSSDKAGQLLSHLRSLEVSVEIEGEQLRVSGPKGVLTPSLREQITTCKTHLIHILRQETAAQRENRVIKALPRPDQFPLSFAQQRLWFLDRLDPRLSVYNIPAIYRLSGELNIQALEQSLQEIVRRHESLRTNLVVGEEGPRQSIKEKARLDVPLIDLRNLPTAKREETAFSLAKEEIAKPYDLAQDLMLRVKLFCLDDASHILVITMHHVASDGWSWAIFWKELTALYAAHCASKPSPLPELPIQYADFAVWQRNWLMGEVLEQELRYWRDQLAGLPSLNLPADYSRPSINSYQGRAERFEVPAKLTAALQNLAQQEGTTLYMLLLAAFNVMLFRYTRQEDIAVGSPIANRRLRVIEDLIGFFVNTLIMRTSLIGNPTFRELLQRVREVTLNAYDHQDLPFEKLVEELRPARDLGHHPLFQVLFTLQNAPKSSPALVGLEVERMRGLNSDTSKFDLSLSMAMRGDGLGGVLDYRTDLFKATTVRRMIDHYQNLLSAVAEDPDCRIGQMPMLSESELRQLLVEWNNTAAPYPRERTIDELFEVRARSAPQAPAVYFEGQTLSYAELDGQANQLAHFLISEGVEPGEIVALALERSLELVVAMLAILKAKAAYLTLDQTNPPARIDWMLEDAQCRILLTDGAKRFSQAAARRVLDLSGKYEIAAIRQQSIERPEHVAASDSMQLAYVMYTSGSTGQPKGVMVPHRAVVRLVQNSHYTQFSPNQRFLQFAPTSFDAATFEIWGPLLNGGQLFVYPSGLTGLAELAQYLRKKQITTLWLTAGLFHQMVEHETETLAGIGHVLTGGDVVSPKHVRQLLQAGGICRLSNAYGPTENTTFTTCYPVIALDEIEYSIPIGRPINNTTVYILDGSLQPVPIGVPGELYTGGDGLALGYLNLPDLTEQTFIANPFSTGADDRLYRTGDIARYRTDGNIEFLGRIDQQVKIRGFRVEPGEIESVLAQHPIVQEVVVLAYEDQPGEKGLVAYLVLAANRFAPDNAELRSFCDERLPSYMVPSAFVIIDSLPLTPNGKIDRAALPAPDARARSAGAPYVAPRSPEEEIIASIWREILQLEQIGICDNFFELGGHSLLGIRLFARIEEEFGRRLPLSLLFSAPSIATLASHLELPAVADLPQTVVPIKQGSARPPFFCVHGFGGGVLGYKELADLMDAEQPFFGLQAAGLNGDGAVDESIEQMAERYVAAMRQVQPSGPYLIGGYCFGGVVAFEMARQLEATGESVPVVAIMEGYAPIQYQRRTTLPSLRRWHTVWQNVPYWLEDYASLGLEGMRIRIKRRGGIWAKRFLRRLGKDSTLEAQDFLTEDLSMVPEHHRQLLESHLLALRNYAPTPMQGDILLFVARGKTIHSAVFGSADPEQGWGALALGGVEIVTVDGGHRNIHLQPHVTSLAAALSEKLRLLEPEANY